MSHQFYNAIVVGSGAGGGIVAKELSTAGFHVLLLERGKHLTGAEFRKDDLYNQRNSTLGAAYGPDEYKNPRVIVHTNGYEQVTTPSNGSYNNNAACVGGGTLSYGAMAWRFMEQDFKMRSIYGAPEGSSLEDWPINYDDLEPYYEKAEWEIGVSGDDSNNPFKGLRKKNLPMPPVPPGKEFEILEPAAKRLGLHPFHIPMLRNSVPYNERAQCMQCRWCVGFACECNAKNGTQNTVIPTALKTGLCELKSECMTTEIRTNDQGKILGVTYIDGNDQEHQVDANIVVISGGAIESARLLLNSKSKVYPNGIGNGNDWVGRNLQGHPYPGAYGFMPYEIYDDVGPGASLAICDYNHGNPGIIGGAMLANEFIRLPYQAVSQLAPGTPRWGAEHKNYMRETYKRFISVKGPVHGIPVFETRVQVDPSVKDYWGLPVARLSGYKHDETIKTADYIAKRAEEWLQEAGAEQIWSYGTGKSFGAGQHQAGTCRMGDDPDISVTDKYCRVHETDNLYVIDGSVHVTNGGFNPVLTIMAIAYWASDHIKQEWSGKIVRDVMI